MNTLHPPSDLKASTPGHGERSSWTQILQLSSMPLVLSHPHVLVLYFSFDQQMHARTESSAPFIHLVSTPNYF